MTDQQQKALRLLGLARRARLLEIGEEPVGIVCRSGKAKLLLVAKDAGDQLHTYTIVDAINDKNVLPFRVDYIKTMDAEPDMDDKQVWDIDREKAFIDAILLPLLDKVPAQCQKMLFSATLDNGIDGPHDCPAFVSSFALPTRVLLEMRAETPLPRFRSVLPQPTSPPPRRV